MQDRRGFLKRVTAALGVALGAVLAWPFVRYLVHPAGKKVVESGDEPVPVAGSDAVPAGGDPVRVEIVAPEQRDGWARRRDVALGAAWLVREASGRLHAFTTTCPHLGCVIDWDPEAKKFRCPCHVSRFGLDGAREAGPAKRGMDPLEVVEEDGRIKVRFQRFVPDVADRRPA